MEDRNEFNGQKLVYYYADIYIRDVESLRRAYANDSYKPGVLENMKDLHNSLNAILSMSGDFCPYKQNSFVVCNGEVLFQSKQFDRDLCVLFKDGSMECYSPADIDVNNIMERDPWQSWNFGPMLLDFTGKAMTEFNLPDHISASNPRAVIGYFSPGHYCFIVVDGRSSRSNGLKIDELSRFLESIGCKAAYNLDGGLTAQMAFGSDRINNPVDNRRIKDVVYIKDMIKNEP